MQSIIIAFALCNLLVIFSHHPLSTTTTLLVLTTSFPHLYTNPCLCLMSTPGTCSWLFVSFELFFVSNRCGDHLLEDSWLELWFQGKQSMKEKCEKRAVLDSLWKHLTSQRLKHKVARQLSQHNFYGSRDRQNHWDKIQRFMNTWYPYNVYGQQQQHGFSQDLQCQHAAPEFTRDEKTGSTVALMCSFNHES